MRTLPTFEAVVGRFGGVAAVLENWRRHRVPFVQQTSNAECGAACLAMVLRYYGHWESLDVLRKATVGGRDTTNAQRLLQIAQSYGLQGRAVAITLEQVEALPPASILHWNFTHFVVLERPTRKGSWIVDPVGGRRRVSVEQLSRSFTGVALVFEPTGAFVKTRRTERPLVGYVKQLAGERTFIPHVVAASVLLQVLGLAPPLVSRALVDYVIPARDYDVFATICVAMIVLAACQVWTSLVRGRVLLYLRVRLDTRMTLAFVSHLMDLPFEFFERRPIGDLLLRVASNTAVRETVTTAVLSGMIDGSLAVAYLAVLVAISPLLAVVTVLIASLQALLLLITRRVQREFTARSVEAQSSAQSFLVETLSGIESLKSMSLESYTVGAWSNLFARQLNVALEQGRLNTILEAIRTALASTSAMVLLAVGVYLVLRDQLKLGETLALIAIANGFVTPVLTVAANVTSLQQVGVYLERLDDVFHASTERELAGTQRADRLAGNINLHDVSFRYGPTSPFVLRHVSLGIRAGETIAIVGRSGSGKSTLARLLIGLHRPTEGYVAYDGVDARSLDIQSVRRSFGVVTQKVGLFGGTIRSNISVAAADLDLSRIEEAARTAHILDDIRAMPMGFDTMLTAAGGSLSGGQQQRLAIARAVVNRPSVLLMDEATNQLDGVSERAVLEEIGRLGCTRIVIAHRLSTVQHADRILVVDAGIVCEEGTHEELLHRRGAYAHLVAAQMIGDSPTRPESAIA